MTIIKEHQISNNSFLECEILIVGSGMSGQVLASKLSSKKIIMIESGKIKYDKNNQLLNEITEVGITSRKNNQSRIRQLGGSANLWANQLMTLDENEISERAWVNKNFSWPFNYDEIIKYYKESINLIYNNNFKDINYFDQDLEKNRNSFLENEILKEKVFNFNNHFWPSKVEKFNHNSKFAKKIINSNNLKFLENFTATEFQINDESQTIENIKVQSNNRTCTIKAEIYVLSCGAIENARILLNNEKNSKIFKNQNIGKYFMDHPRICLGILKSKQKIPLSNLLGIKYKNYDFRKSVSLSKIYQRKKKILSAYAFLDPKYKIDDEIMFENFLNELKKIIKFKGLPKIDYKNIKLKELFEQIYLKLSPQISNSNLNNFIRTFFEKKNYYLSFDEMYVNYQAEQFPNFNSKIYLSDKKDQYNQQKAIIDWQLNEIDYKTHNEFSLVLKNKFKSNTFLEFNEYEKKIITDANHHSGTTRMSLDREDGVVDKNCKFHDIKNLYISGNSVFRSSGCVNPGLTNSAMSIRLGEHLQRILK